MKTHSVSDIITNSSAMIFVQAKNKTPIEEFFEKLGTKVTVEYVNDPGWIDSIRVNYEDEYWDDEEQNVSADAPSFESYLENYEDDGYDYDDSKTIVATLESGEKVDLKNLFQSAFEIEATHN
jgi:hypothetical protein